jgi:hypothetical protein
MPRGPRLDAPGVLHHVMARGIEKTLLFRTAEDRTDFLRRLAAQVEPTGSRSSRGPCSRTTSTSSCERATGPSPFGTSGCPPPA